MAATSPDKQKQHAALAKLTEREREVAVLVAHGECNKEIARELNIAERTVKAHLSTVFEKLDVRDRLQLAIHLRN
ncbi:MAG: response regulator transcription factor [Deltaproteobacteria bacterium]|nr:response regulator transcription factor [Deltaproteobacteria bacterium]